MEEEEEEEEDENSFFKGNHAEIPLSFHQRIDQNSSAVL